MTAPLTDPLSLVLAALTALVAVAVGVLQWPRPPALDGERWFKVMVCTLLRGRMDAEGATAAAWEREVIRVVPYHPAGRFPERKLSNPVAAVLPAAALPGEQALVEALARRPEPQSRAAFLYDEDEAGRDARLADPAALGDAYDPSRLGPGATWDTLASWGHGDRTFVAAALRAVPATWILVEGRRGLPAQPSLLPFLAAELGASARPAIPYDELPLGPALRAAASAPGDRIVIVAEEAGVVRVLQALVEDADLRDHVAGVLAIGGVIGGRTDEAGALGEGARRDWLAAHFNHEDLDTEIVRRTPYFAVQWLDRTTWPPGTPGLPLSAGRFPEPTAKGAIVDTVEPVDLGVLPADRPVPADLYARGLVAVVCAWISSRR